MFADNLMAASFTIKTILEIRGTNNTLTEKKATLKITAFDLHSEWTMDIDVHAERRAHGSCEHQAL